MRSTDVIEVEQRINEHQSTLESSKFQLADILSKSTACGEQIAQIEARGEVV